LSSIIDLKKQRFIKDCKDFLKTGNITDSLRASVLNTTPGHMDYIKKDLDDESKKIIDIVIGKVTEKFRKDLATHRQKINIMCQAVIENLETNNSRFEIPEVIVRYRESINPVKALYYDLQEIMFLYDGKPKNKHHKFLIEKFSKPEDFNEIMFAIERDLEDLKECKSRIKEIKDNYKLSSNSEYSKKVLDLHNEMGQWQKLFKKFPDWVNENKSETPVSLFNTLKNFFG
jgi:uncharacterized protein YukE